MTDDQLNLGWEFWEGSDREPADDDDDDDDEFPLAVSLKEKVRVLRAGKTKLEKHLSNMQDLWQKAKLLAKPQWPASRFPSAFCFD